MLNRGAGFVFRYLWVLIVAGSAAWVFAETRIESRLDQRLAQNTTGAAVTQYAEPITITYDSTDTAITTSLDIRVSIPSSVDMIWDTSITSAVAIIGTASANASPSVSYEVGDPRVLIVNVINSDFSSAANSITVYGLKFSVPASGLLETLDNLELRIAGTSGGVAEDDDNQAITIYDATLDATKNFIIDGTPTSTSLPQVKVKAISGLAITTSGDILIRIPSTWLFSWDTSVLTVEYGGVTGKISGNPDYTYNASNKIVRFDVGTAFAASDEITIDGLKFAGDFTDRDPPSDRLELIIAGSSAGFVAVHDRRLVAPVGGLTMRMASQNIAAGVTTTLNEISIATGTNAIAASPTDSGDLRIAIPIENGITFTDLNTSSGQVTVTVSGSPGAIDSAAPVIEDDNVGQRVLRFNVTTAFTSASNATITISGMQVLGGSAAEKAELYALTQGPHKVSTVLTDASGNTASTTGGSGGGGGGGEFIRPGSPVSIALVLLAALAAACGPAALRRLRRM